MLSVLYHVRGLGPEEDSVRHHYVVLDMKRLHCLVEGFMGTQGRLNGECRLGFTCVDHLGEIAALVGNVRDSLKTSIGEENEVAAVGVVSVARLCVSM